MSAAAGQRWLQLGSVLGFLGVGLGAFGAHALKARLPPDLLAVFETGVRYQMYHALALMALGLATSGLIGEAPARRSGLAFALGTLIFSGTLYALALTGQRWLGAVTPVGGGLLLLGWLNLAIALGRRHSE
ncbi:MAG: DUF423 domain-containing protein [Candidatus Eisenbacteria bacterium]|nr:DUF423 domain-containing protein [Candidatus Eisenbacteria bacterium]